jgi:hypothetical protein
LYLSSFAAEMLALAAGLLARYRSAPASGFLLGRFRAFAAEGAKEGFERIGSFVGGG